MNSVAVGLAAPFFKARKALSATGIDADWALYKERYLHPEGRIVDTGNGNISHSEGQGYGMFFASTFADKPAFDKIWSWTRDTLRRHHDHLHAWRWTPSSPHISDTNNASDGDLMIAWALYRASILWGNDAYRLDALEILRDLSEKCVRKVGSRLVLLPGLRGFDHQHMIIVNLSYYIAPALIRAARIDPQGPWSNLLEQGTQLVRASRFGLWGLPPDWLAIEKKTERIFPASGFPPRFSYDAIRIPLYMKWAHRLPSEFSQSLTAVCENWSFKAFPGWIDLTSGERSSYNAPPGFQAVVAFALDGANALSTMPSMRESQDYYSSSLTLQARIASMEMV